VLKPGYRADLTLIDRDLFEANPARLLESQVVATIVDGAVAFERKVP
jgi:predicted amidohydrolase YtcJ